MPDAIVRFKKVRRSLKESRVVQFISQYRRQLAVIVLAVFFIFLFFYISLHPDILQNVGKIGILKLSFILILYFGVVLTNFGIMYATIKLCKKQLSAKSGLLLTMYSSVVNFFGPLQSGPAVRAVYLKTKIGLRIRDYTYAMLFYYFAFAAINVSLLFISNLLWISILGILTGIILTIYGTKKLGFGRLGRYVFLIFILTLVQIILITIIYAAELHVVNPAAHYTILQTISYTASANLSLFVSLTPGGIGIREAFLIFSQSLHHIQLGSIVAAGILDRAIYVIFLIILFVVTSGLHLKQTFAGKQAS